MSRTPIALLFVLLGGIVSPAVAEPARIDLIVDRDETSVAVFLSVRGDDLLDTLGHPAGALRDATGAFPFATYQQEGTADLAENLIGATDLRLDGAAVDFAPMSMMLHRETDRLPFETPIDGWIAISVCGTETPDRPLDDDEIRVYAGFTAYPVDGSATLSVALPHAEPVEVSVREYRMGALLDQRTETVGPGELVMAAGQPPSLMKDAARWGGIVFSFALVAGTALWWRRAVRAGRQAWARISSTIASASAKISS